MKTASLFAWHSFDLDQQLRLQQADNWAEEIQSFAVASLKKTPIVPRSTTSREADRNAVIQAAVVDGVVIKQRLPWLYRLYRTDFLALASRATGQRLLCASNDLYGVNLNVQIGTEMRYECHVDSNPVQGMLYVTAHDAASGGQLIVANCETADSVTSVLENCARIDPRRGLLVFFDARRHSHFVSALTRPDGVRVAAAMNFYTQTCPEARRPADLSRHLGLA
jgi:hypothetical protein